jgi:hypothetical protein
LEIASDPELERQEYLKKVTKLLGMTDLSRRSAERAERSFASLVEAASSSTWYWIQKCIEDPNQKSSILYFTRLIDVLSQKYGSSMALTFKQKKEAITLMKTLNISLRLLMDSATPSDQKRIAWFGKVLGQSVK